MDYKLYLREMVGTKPVIMVTSDVAVLNKRRELLLQLRAKDNSWGLIGGFMELGETVEGTARREVSEETGLQIGKLELLGVFSDADLLTYPNGDQIQLVTVAFLTDDVTGTPRLSSEGLELRYFALNALPDKLFTPNSPILEAFREKSTNLSAEMSGNTATT